jgi:serine/threonine protein kinase
MGRRSGSFQAPPGFRDSDVRAVAAGDVVASTYMIRDELARTDTGLVFEARDMAVDRVVALKLAWRDPGTPSLLIEARRCAAVRDPCAVAIYGVGHHQNIEYVVGERVIGRPLAATVQPPPAAGELIRRLRGLVAAVTRAHEAGIAIGDISGATVLVDDAGRTVLGRLSLSQVPAFGPLGHVVAPEVVRGDVEASDPSAAEAIDLYGLGCVALELATGRPPFFTDDNPDAILRGHASEVPPRLADVRADLPLELSDLVEWLVEKRPIERPRSARDVLAQLDAIIERHGPTTRPLRVLVVDDDAARGRWLWSLVRRAHAAAQVELATEGTDAAHKLNRDLPDLVFVDVALRGVMNAYELCMYARGVEVDQRAQLILIGELTERDRALFANAQVTCLADDHLLGSVVLDRVRTATEAPHRRRRSRSTVSG